MSRHVSDMTHSMFHGTLKLMKTAIKLINDSVMKAAHGPRRVHCVIFILVYYRHGSHIGSMTGLELWAVSWYRLQPRPTINGWAVLDEETGPSRY